MITPKRRRVRRNTRGSGRRRRKISEEKKKEETDFDRIEAVVSYVFLFFHSIDKKK